MDKSILPICFAIAGLVGCLAADLRVERHGPGIAKRLCAHRGLSAALPENSLPAFGAAVAAGAAEIEFDLWWTKDGEIVSLHDATLGRVSNGSGAVYEKTFAELKDLDFGIRRGEHFKGLRIVRFEDILRQFAGRTIMNIHLKTTDGHWQDEHLAKVLELIDRYGVRRSVYFMTEWFALQEQLARAAPDIPRCMGHSGTNANDEIVDNAVKYGCRMVQLFKPYFTGRTFERAHAAGLRCNVYWADDPEEAKRLFEMGADTVLTNDYLPVSAATGVK